MLVSGGRHLSTEGEGRGRERGGEGGREGGRGGGRGGGGEINRDSEGEVVSRTLIHMNEMYAYCTCTCRVSSAVILSRERDGGKEREGEGGSYIASSVTVRERREAIYM